MSEIINYTRLTTSDKFQDRFLTCQVYEPVDADQAQMGTIFSSVEILNPWFPTSQIGQTVINTLIREYYRGTDTSELVNFENAVKKVNETLAQIAQNGETDWIGKFNGCFVLVNGTEAHFAQTGTSHAYLFRGSRINHITEGLGSTEAPHPLKTFGNLTSGSLQENDKIVVANSTFFELISPTELKTIITSYRPMIAATEAAKILKSHNANDANAIFLELTDKDSLANIPPDHKDDTVYIDHFSSFDFGRFLKSIGKHTAKIAKAGHKYLAPKVNRGWKITKIASSNLARGAMKVGIDTGKKIKAGASDKIEIINSRKKNEADMPLSDAPKSKTFFLKIKNRLRRFLIRIGFYSRQKSKMIFAVLVAILIILGTVITVSVFEHSKIDKDKSLEQKLSEAADLQNQAALKTVKGDEAGALIDYKTIVSLASDLKNTKYYGEVQPIEEKALTKIASITKLSYLNSTKNTDLNDGLISLSMFGEDIIGVFSNGSVAERKSGDSLFIPVASVSLPSDKIASSASLFDQNKMALLFSNNKLSTFDFAKKTLINQDVKINTGSAIKTFSDTVYLLDQKQNQICKIPSENGNYKTESTYIKDSSVTVSDTVDLAIDGSVYTLSQNGKLTKFSRGTKSSETDISLPGSEKINTWFEIFTDESTNSIFAFLRDSGNSVRVVEIKKGGNFVAQFGLKDTGGFSFVSMNPDTRMVYVTRDKTMLEFKI